MMTLCRHLLNRLALLGGLLLSAGIAAADGPGWAPLTEAWFEAPGDVYPHRILGRIPEYFVLAARDEAGQVARIDLRDRPGPPAVFEDVAPRIADADGDGRPDIVVVETLLDGGAQLAIYAFRGGRLQKVTATPPIGQRFRWLAPLAIADLDGDGTVDIAYVETPHVAPKLRVWTWAPGGLTARTELAGVTNHRIGDEMISGGLRDCGEGPELVLADAGWTQIVSVQIEDGRPVPSLVARPIGGTPDAAGFAAALDCRSAG